MQLTISELKGMAESVVREGLGFTIELGLTSIGWTPHARLQAVFEGEATSSVCTHLIQVELTQVDDDRMYGQLIKPASLVGMKLVFTKRPAWTYHKMYR